MLRDGTIGPYIHVTSASQVPGHSACHPHPAFTPGCAADSALLGPFQDPVRGPEPRAGQQDTGEGRFRQFGLVFGWETREPAGLTEDAGISAQGPPRPTVSGEAGGREGTGCVHPKTYKEGVVTALTGRP